MMKYLQSVALSTVLAFSANAAATERVMIVFDASGSMWGQIDGKPKHVIARQALNDMLGTISDSMELGLIAYGHREKGSCADIETLVQPGPNNKTAIMDAVQNMKFLGKTPLSAAVQQAAEGLRYTEEKATVVLITDGEETCQADPCALGTELKQSGVDFTAHVVGFDLSAQQGEQVACLAHNTGGQYFAAANAADLTQAIQTTVQAIQAVPVVAEPIPEPEPAQATIDGPEVAGVGSLIEVQWTGPRDPSDYIALVAAGAKEGTYDTYKRVGKEDTVQVLTPDRVGAHEIRYVHSKTAKTLATQAIELIEVEATISGPETAGAGSKIEVNWTGPDSPDDYITVVELGAPDAEYNDYVRTKSKSSAELVVPDGLGKYEIRYVLSRSMRVLASQPINLIPVTASVKLMNQAVPGGKVTVEWVGPDNVDDYVTIVPKGAPSDKYLSYTRTNKGSPVVLSLPEEEGDYEVRYVLQRSKRVLASVPVVLAASVGTIKAPESVVAGSVIEVEWTGPGNREDFIEVVPAEADIKTAPLAATRVTQGSPLSLHAPAIPGKYVVRYMMRQTKEVLVSAPLEVVENM